MENWTQSVTGLLFVVGILIVDRFVLLEPAEIPQRMVWIEPGSFIMGADRGEPDHEVHLEGFWIDQQEVSNDQFAAFIEATGYKSSPDQDPNIQVRTFTVTDRGVLSAQADWRKRIEHPEPQHPQDSDKGKLPFLHAIEIDGAAYCEWAGKELATEAQFDFVAHLAHEQIISSGHSGFRCVINHYRL